MLELIPIFLTGMFLTALSEGASHYTRDPYGRRIYRVKDKFFFTLMVVVLVFFCGLRTTYNDTETYIFNYLVTPSAYLDLNINWSIGANPGYNIIRTLFRYWGVPVNVYLMFYAIITNGIYLWFIRKYTNNILLSMFLYFTLGCYTFTFAAIKQCVAVAFCLLAVESYLQDKKLGYIAWIVVAMLFHPYSFLFFAIFLLDFEPWSGRTAIFLLLSVGLALCLRPLMSIIVGVAAMIGEEYTMDTFTGGGVNGLRVLVVWAPLLLSYLTKNGLTAHPSRETNLFFNLSLLNAAIMFIGLFGTANYFARLANYFLIFQVLLIPEVLRNFNASSRKLILGIMTVAYLVFFWYSNIIYGGFDFMYSRITLGEFFEQLFRG